MKRLLRKLVNVLLWVILFFLFLNVFGWIYNQFTPFDNSIYILLATLLILLVSGLLAQKCVHVISDVYK
ncbi:hypothetical protein [Alkalicoccobacillus porphyridii]|uniref:Uncharacterized protein n=1 Tax=Alkalicoccobacillus porphyridii TaxID=2597270 RepID=A0A553ZTL3_9BACI|nr:hypothetical protein [Alkalicoccobacillus porphyridii]TSB44818.1 hypothetical protein FN960_19635 [Alkalicoccobacillus porphyridii]